MNQTLRTGIDTLGNRADSTMGTIRHVILVVALAAACFAQNDVDAIIRRSVEANALDWKTAPDYDYFERDAQQGGGTKTYEELMILGSPHEKLVAVNGKPLSREQQAQEQRKLRDAIVDRQRESQRERGGRIAKYEKGRKRDHLMMEQLSKALDFRLLGEQTLGPYKVYVLKATPHSGYKPPNYETEVLTGMEGELWIDEKTFQWVKVEATVIRPVSIGGFLAEVEPGTCFELEKTSMEGRIWVPKHFAIKSQAKVLFFFTRKSQADETYYGYYKAAPVQAGVPDKRSVVER
ncbi:MAG: hypothetical protein WCD02_03420 [Terriglobales bacterium]